MVFSSECWAEQPHRAALCGDVGALAAFRREPIPIHDAAAHSGWPHAASDRERAAEQVSRASMSLLPLPLPRRLPQLLRLPLPTDAPSVLATSSHIQRVEQEMQFGSRNRWSGGSSRGRLRPSGCCPSSSRRSRSRSTAERRASCRLRDRQRPPFRSSWTAFRLRADLRQAYSYGNLQRPLQYTCLQRRWASRDGRWSRCRSGACVRTTRAERRGRSWSACACFVHAATTCCCCPSRCTLSSTRQTFAWRSATLLAARVQSMTLCTSWCSGLRLRPRELQTALLAEELLPLLHIRRWFGFNKRISDEHYLISCILYEYSSPEFCNRTVKFL